VARVLASAELVEVLALDAVQLQAGIASVEHIQVHKPTGLPAILHGGDTLGGLYVLRGCALRVLAGVEPDFFVIR
jgi:hypothetical protein